MLGVRFHLRNAVGSGLVVLLDSGGVEVCRTLSDLKGIPLSTFLCSAVCPE
jgi:hypothetical protein